MQTFNYAKLSAKTLQAVFDAAFPIEDGDPPELGLKLAHNGLNREAPWSVSGRVTGSARTLFDLLVEILVSL